MEKGFENQDKKDILIKLPDGRVINTSISIIQSNARRDKTQSRSKYNEMRG